MTLHFLMPIIFKMISFEFQKNPERRTMDLDSRAEEVDNATTRCHYDENEILLDFFQHPEYLLRYNPTLQSYDKPAASAWEYLNEFATTEVIIVTFLGLSDCSAANRDHFFATLFPSEYGHQNHALKKSTRPKSDDVGIVLFGSMENLVTGQTILLLELFEDYSPSKLACQFALLFSSTLLYYVDPERPTQNSAMLEAYACHQSQMSHSNDEHECPTLAWMALHHDDNNAPPLPSSSSSSSQGCWPPHPGLMGAAPLRTFVPATFPLQSSDHWPTFCRAKKIFRCGKIIVDVMHNWTEQCQVVGEDGDENNPEDLFVQSLHKVLEHECSRVAREALTLYHDCIDESQAREARPMEMSELTSHHDQITRLALDYFYSESQSLFLDNHAMISKIRRRVKLALRQDLDNHRTSRLSQLTEHSTQYCLEVRTRALERWTKATTSDDGPQSVSEFETQFQTYFRSCQDEMAGPSRDTTLIQLCCVRDSIEMLRSVNLRQLVRLEWEPQRAALEQELRLEWQARKHELVNQVSAREHERELVTAREKLNFDTFMEASQSRLGMTQEAHADTVTQLGECQRRVEVLEERVMVAQHAAEAQTRVQTQLELELSHVRETLDVERRAADALREVVSGALKQVEDLEARHALEMHELKAEHDEKVGESQHRAETLREERDILQTKVNDFFMKISTLPLSIQQQLFVPSGTQQDHDELNEDGSMKFADVLSTYMDSK